MIPIRRHWIIIALDRGRGADFKGLDEGLTIQDAKGVAIPGAAESWSLSDDGLTYTLSRRVDGKWSNPAYDALMDKAAVTADLKERAKIMDETLFLNEVPALPILYYSSRALVSPSVSGYEDNLMDAHATRWLSVTP